jgi:putative transposase
MDAATYALIPEALILRELRFNVVEPGRRTQTIDIITTLTDADEYTKEDMAELYGFRWSSELHIRNIKSNLNLAQVRCKSSEMVHRELWTTILGYNLIRTASAGAAPLRGKQPRQISFASSCHYVLASWIRSSSRLIDEAKLSAYLFVMLE